MNLIKIDCSFDNIDITSEEVDFDLTVVNCESELMDSYEELCDEELWDGEMEGELWDDSIVIIDVTGSDFIESEFEVNDGSCYFFDADKLKGKMVKIVEVDNKHVVEICECDINMKNVDAFGEICPGVFKSDCYSLYKFE